ncbi:MAG: LysR family transcriptional regulator substrate-binding protein [Rothia sp. (in: high G+C Gram-positive bacteria)]|uniref:LysR family transcriptional regulator substrate-binding protein n=1 Tax=Rothia sp. (in: high G+C Gram-positive bacteria) TaxID=1885016 RepID=UPI0026F4A621|nr:LysR family transcriptional regulator substrate-binding protein [Rothia sp. (in: high G+C Gram-positive bacteria)]
MTLSELILARPDLLVDDQTARYEHVGQIPGLCVGFVPGVMPGKWFNRWRERYSALAPLTDVALGEGRGLQALEAFADMVLVRAEDEPAARDKKRYHAIELYRETPVVVLPKDHLLTVLESVPLAELAEEFLLQNPDEVPEWRDLSADYRAENPRPLPQMRHRADAVELVAAGLGLLLVPMSVARFYHRKDLTYRPVEGVEDYPVLLVWKREVREDVREQVIQDFVGITRGRTAASQRGSDSREVALEKQRREKEEAKRKRAAANKRREAEDRKKRNAQKSGNLRQYQAQKGGKVSAKGSGRGSRGKKR